MSTQRARRNNVGIVKDGGGVAEGREGSEVEGEKRLMMRWQHKYLLDESNKADTLLLQSYKALPSVSKRLTYSWSLGWEGRVRGVRDWAERRDRRLEVREAVGRVRYLLGKIKMEDTKEITVHAVPNARNQSSFGFRWLQQVCTRVLINKKRPQINVSPIQRRGGRDRSNDLKCRPVPAKSNLVMRRKGDEMRWDEMSLEIKKKREGGCENWPCFCWYEVSHVIDIRWWYEHPDMGH